MKHFWILFTLFLIVIMEGVALELLPARLVHGDLLIVPHWVLVYLVYVLIYYDKENTYTSVFLAIIFGLMIDIVYTGVLGVYMFTYALVVYIIHGLKTLLQSNLYVTLLFGFLGIVLSDLMIYSAFLIIDITEATVKHYLMYRLIPTIVANLIFLLILYPFVRQPLVRWQEEQ